ncbi:MAG: porin family protein [Elusimicrobiota bacterium]
MKKIIILIIFTFILFTADRACAREISYGAKAGINIASIAGDDADLKNEDIDKIISLGSADMPENLEAVFSPSPTAGVNIGGWINFPLKNYFSVQPELNFSRKGVIYKKTIEDTSLIDGETRLVETQVRNDIKFSYITIPVFASLDFPEWDYMKSSIYLGPSLGINIDSVNKFEKEVRIDGILQEDLSEEGTKDIDFINPLELSIVIGGGLEVSEFSTLDIRYSRSLTTIHNPEGDYEELDFKNSVFTVSAGYRF